ncbi:MAG TPA: phage head closure protein [Terriglobales bacterium]|jgi:head-tail adaptor|nr:phage head closure protein [Terriglobales bacterium]
MRPLSNRIEAGKLRNRIAIVLTDRTQDSTGGVDNTAVVLYAQRWASIDAVSGNEAISGQQTSSKVTHRVVIRYIGAAPSWQSLWIFLGGALVKDSNGNLQQAQSGGGTSGAVAPTWNATVGGFTSDGDPSTGITWKNLGAAPNRTGINSSMQVVFNGRLFQVEYVQNPDERTKKLILMCSETNDSLQYNPTVAPSNIAALLSPGETVVIDGGSF